MNLKLRLTIMQFPLLVVVYKKIVRNRHGTLRQAIRSKMFFLSILFFFITETINANIFYNCDSCTCDVHNLVKMQENMDNLKIAEIVNFLSTFDGRCTNNIEYSELSNVILYSMLCNNMAYVVVKILSENNELPFDNIKQAIENPVNDRIDINKAYRNIKTIKKYRNIRNSILQSINIAIAKS